MNNKIVKCLMTILEFERDVSEDPEFNAMDYSGGNFDDAFDLGVRAGKVKLAKVLLKILKETRMK